MVAKMKKTKRGHLGLKTLVLVKANTEDMPEIIRNTKA